MSFTNQPAPQSGRRAAIEWDGFICRDRWTRAWTQTRHPGCGCSRIRHPGEKTERMSAALTTLADAEKKDVRRSGVVAPVG
jgi:hypothetical protein